MCAGSEFQVDDAETENTREVKLLVMPEGLARRFVLEERTALDGRSCSFDDINMGEQVQQRSKL